MKTAMVKPVLATIGGAKWPLLFNLGSIWRLEELFSPDGNPLQSGIRGFIEAQKRLSVWDLEVLIAFFWAGLLHESPELTLDDARDLLDQASPDELVRLPAAILEALGRAIGTGSAEGYGGEPWSWDVALAVWIKEWGRSEEEFWQATFSTIRTISDGLAKLYKSISKGTGPDAPPDGYDLIELISPRRR